MILKLKSLAGSVFNLPGLRGSKQAIRRRFYEYRMRTAERHLARDRDKLEEIFSHLTPRKVIGFDKRRTGADEDGGYVMLDDFARVTLAYSLGVSDDVSWDLDMAKLGIPVRQFDYSVEGPPVANPLFSFSKTKIEKVGDLGLSEEPGPILKIDIEGSEWGFLANASPEELAKFQQITGEFHDFDRYHEPEWQQAAVRAFRKLGETHQLIHLHGNNRSSSFDTGRFRLPIALELSYVLKSAYSFEKTDEPFPGPLDRPNDKAAPDSPLNGIFE